MHLALSTVYPKKYAHGFCFAVLCCGYTLTDFPISIRLTSLALWQSNDCHSASKATLMNMDKHFMWIHYERLHNHNKAKHNKTVCIFLGIYCMYGNSGGKSGMMKCIDWTQMNATLLTLYCDFIYRWVILLYAVNRCVSLWNGRDTMDVINFFISRPGGLTREKV